MLRRAGRIRGFSRFGTVQCGRRNGRVPGSHAPCVCVLFHVVGVVRADCAPAMCRAVQAMLMGLPLLGVFGGLCAPFTRVLGTGRGASCFRGMPMFGFAWV